MPNSPTVDIAITANRKYIVLIKRAKEPFMDKLVLPGGHIDPEDRSPAHACAREAREELGLVVSPKRLIHLMDLTGPERDPRPGHDLSHVFTIDFPHISYLASISAQSDAREIVICQLRFLFPQDLGFDHWKVIEDLKRRFRPS